MAVVCNFLLLCFMFLSATAKDYLTFSNSKDFLHFLPTYYTGKDFTEEVWIYVHTAQTSGIGIMRQDASYQIAVDENNFVGAGYWDMNGDYSETMSVNHLPSATWIHLSLSYTFSELKLILYEDGVSQVEISANLPLSTGKHFLLYYLGTEWTISFAHYRFWDVSLISTDILSMKDSAIAPAERIGNLLALFPLEDIETYCLQDWSRFGNHVCQDYSYNDFAYTSVKFTKTGYHGISSSNAFQLSTSASISIPPQIQMNDEWSIEFWILPGGDGNLLSQPDCVNNEGLLIVQVTDYMKWYPANPTVTTTLSSTSDSSWHFLAFVTDIEEKALYIHQCSTSALTLSKNSISHSGSSLCNDSPIVFNEEQTLTSKIQEFRVWNRPRKPYEIQTYAPRRLFPQEHSELLIYFPFDEHSPQTFTDQTYNGATFSSTTQTGLWTTGTVVCPLGWMYYSGSCYRLKASHYEYALKDQDSWQCIPHSIIGNTYSAETVGFWLHYIDIQYKLTSVLIRANDFDFSTHTKTTFSLMMYVLDEDGVTTKEYLDNTKNVLSTDRWCYITFSKALYPFYNNGIFGGEEITAQSQGFGYCDTSASSVCFGTNEKSEMYRVNKEMNYRAFSFHFRYSSMVELRKNYHKKHYSYEDVDFVRYYPLENVGSFGQFYDTVYLESFDILSDAYDFSTSNLKHYCPFHKRAPNDYQCLPPGILILRSIESDLLTLSAPELKIVSDFTFQIILKFKYEGKSGTIYLLKHSNVIDIGVTSSRKVFTQLYDSNGQQVLNWETDFQLQESIFYSLSITRKNSQLNIYTNDELIETFFIDSDPFQLNSQSKETVNIETGGATLWIRELKLWNRELSLSEITYDVYSQILGREYPYSLRLYYKLDEPGATILYDSSYRRDSSPLYNNQISTDMSSVVGIGWDFHNDLYVCEPHQRKIANQCTTRNRVLKFLNSETDPSICEDFELGNEYNIEFWGYFYSQTATPATILQKDNHINLKVQNQGTGSQIQFIFEGSLGTNNNDGNPSILIEDSGLVYDEWNFLAVSNSAFLDKSMAMANLADPTIESAFIFSDTSSYSSSLCIGSTCDSDSGNTFDGFLKELKIWKKYRSQGEIVKSRFNSISGVEEYLVGYWKLDDAVGNTIHDLGPNQKHLTFTDSSNKPQWIYRKVSNESRVNAQMCSKEEVYDTNKLRTDSYEGCTLPFYRFTPEGTLSLKIASGISTDMPENFAIEFMILANSLTSFTIKWPNRFKFGLSSTFVPRFTLLGSSDTNAGISGISTLSSSVWIRIYFSYSIELGKTNFGFDEYPSNFGICKEELTIDHSYNKRNSVALKIIGSSFSGFMRELRIWSSYIPYDSQRWKAGLTSQLEGSQFNDLISYWKFDENGGSYLYDSSIYGFKNTITSVSGFEWTPDSPYSEDYLFCPSNSYLYEFNGCVEMNQIIYKSKPFIITCSDTCTCSNTISSELCEYNFHGNYVNSINPIKFTIMDESQKYLYSWETNPVIDITVSEDALSMELTAPDSISFFTVYIFKASTLEEDSEFGGVVTIQLKISENPSGGTFTVDSSSGIGYESTFTFTANSYVDPQTTELRYSYYYTKTGTTTQTTILENSVLTTFEKVFPPGLEDGNYEITVYAKICNLLGGCITESVTITVNIPTSTSLTSESLSSDLELARIQGSQEWAQAVDKALYQIPYIQIQSNSDEECTQIFQSFGVCDATIPKCQCEPDYQKSKDCSITDQQYQQNQLYRTLIVENLKEMTNHQGFVEELLTNDEIGETYFSSMESVSINQFLMTDQLNSILISAIHAIASAQVDVLQRSTLFGNTAQFEEYDDYTEPPNPVGLSDYGMDLAYKSLDYIIVGLINIPDDKKTAFELLKQIPEILDLLLMRTMCIATEETTKNLEYSSFQSVIQNLYSDKLVDSKLIQSEHSEKATVQLPSGKIVEETETKVYSFHCTTWKQDPFIYIRPDEYAFFVSPVSISLINVVDFSLQPFDNLEEDIEVSFKINNCMLINVDKKMKIGWITDEGEISSTGITFSADSNIKTLSDSEIVVTFSTNHLTDFVFFYEEPVQLGKSWLNWKLVLRIYDKKTNSRTDKIAPSPTFPIHPKLFNMKLSQNKFVTEGIINLEDFKESFDENNKQTNNNFMVSQSYRRFRNKIKKQNSLQKPRRKIVIKKNISSRSISNYNREESSPINLLNSFALKDNPKDVNDKNLSSISLDQTIDYSRSIALEESKGEIVEEINARKEEILEKPVFPSPHYIFMSSHIFLSWTLKYPSIFGRGARLYLGYLKAITSFLFIGLINYVRRENKYDSFEAIIVMEFCCFAFGGIFLILFQNIFKLKRIGILPGNYLKIVFGSAMSIAILIGILYIASTKDTTKVKNWTILCLFGLLLDLMVFQVIKYIAIITILKCRSQQEKPTWMSHIFINLI